MKELTEKQSKVIELIKLTKNILGKDSVTLRDISTCFKEWSPTKLCRIMFALEKKGLLTEKWLAHSLASIEVTLTK